MCGTLGEWVDEVISALQRMLPSEQRHAIESQRPVRIIEHTPGYISVAVHEPSCPFPTEGTPKNVWAVDRDEHPICVLIFVDRSGRLALVEYFRLDCEPIADLVRTRVRATPPEKPQSMVGRR